MPIYSRLRHLDSLIQQILKIGCIAVLISLLLWNSEPVAANSQQAPLEVSITPVTLSVPLPKKQRTEKESRFILNIEGVEYDPRNVVPYEIYLNLPSGVKPDPNSPYYAGTLALFAYVQGDTYSLDVTDAVCRLKNSNLLKDDNISVTIVPPKPEQFITTAQAEARSPRLAAPVIRFQRVSITQ